MSVRVSLAALAALTLAGCTLPVQPQQQAAACCCKAQCPTDAAPAAAGSGKATRAAASTGSSVSTDREVVATRVVHRPRVAVRRERVERRYYAGERELSGGAYGGRYAGVSVSVSETESSSERYRYSESEERWGSRGGSSYASGSSSSSGSASGSSAGYGRDGRYGPPPAADHPRGRRDYALAGKDRDGYLTWPGKVED
jgi:hypothetical protein